MKRKKWPYAQSVQAVLLHSFSADPKKHTQFNGNHFALMYTPRTPQLYTFLFGIFLSFAFVEAFYFYGPVFPNISRRLQAVIPRNSRILGSVSHQHTAANFAK